MKIKAGTTSEMLPIFVQDTSSTTGGGLSGLVFNTAGLVAEYRRRGQSSWTTITLAAGTLGTYSSGGFVADGSLAGAYELGIPDAALAAGARSVTIRLRGATNMLPVLQRIELDAVDYQDAAGFGLSRLDVSVGSRLTVESVNSGPYVAGTIGYQIANIPTAIQNADALLKRDWASVTGEAGRSVINALRAIRNKWYPSGSTIVYTKEDDTTPAWTATVTTSPSAEGVTSFDPT